MDKYNCFNHELDFLCLDLSLDRTGWSIFKKGKMYKYGIVECNDGSLRHIERLMCISNVIRNIMSEYSVDCVLIEDVHYGKSVSTFKYLCELRGLVLVAAYEFVGNDIFIFPPSHPRSCFNPNGEKIKDKKAAFDYVASLYPDEDFNFNDHNDICDSILLGLSFMEYKSVASKKMTLAEKKLSNEDMKQHLYRQHWVDGVTIKELSKQLKVSYNIILTWFNNTKLPIKTGQ